MPKNTLLLLALLAAARVAVAAGDEFTLVIKDHRFEPQELRIPADTKIRLTIRNDDSTPEEFESYELNREKIVRGNSSIIVYIGPLEPGRYPFFGEFNMDSAKGVIVAD